MAASRVLVTRPRDQAGPLVEQLAAAGFEVLLLPAIEIVPIDATSVDEQVAVLPPPDLLIYVSSNAARYGARLAPASALVAAIGPATRNTLQSLGVRVTTEPAGGADSEHLLADAALQDLTDKTVWIVRGQRGRELLGDTLAERGARVHYVAAYERHAAHADADAVADATSQLVAGHIAFTIVMSVESLDGLASILGDPDLNLLRQSVLVTPSSRVIQSARQRQASIQCRLAGSPGPQGLLAAIQEAGEEWATGSDER